MVNKNRELDQPIIAAAKEEFLKNGFMGTSIHVIAQKAGVTTGAIYTRYKSKDELFCSLVEKFFQSVQKERTDHRESYLRYCSDKNFDAFMDSMVKETVGYLDILFEYYEECKLLLCCSKGSSLEKVLYEMMRHKATEIKKFIKEQFNPNLSDITSDCVDLLLNQQFQIYSFILEKGYNREETVEYMRVMGEFAVAGWKRIFEEFIQSGK